MIISLVSILIFSLYVSTVACAEMPKYSLYLDGGEAPLNSNINLKQVKVPVLDIYAENDRDAKFAEKRQHFVSDRFKQVPISGAKHDYGCCESAVNAAVIAWLKIQETKH